MGENQPIATAPRNGLSIIVGDPDCGEFVMHYNPTGGNTIFQPDEIGIWEAADKSFTWSEKRGDGPTYWRPLTDNQSQKGGQ